MALQPKEQNVGFHLKDAILNTFKVQFGIEVKVVSVKVEANNANTFQNIACLSVIGISSSSHAGTLAIGFSESSYCRLLKTMLDEDHAKVDESNADACSEVLNIIYSSSRVKMNEEGFDFNPAIPTTIIGKNLALAGTNAKSLFFMRCDSDVGEFVFAMTLNRKTKQLAA